MAKIGDVVELLYQGRQPGTIISITGGTAIRVKRHDNGRIVSTWIGYTRPATTARLYQVHFRLAATGPGSGLETSMVVLAESREEAIQKIIIDNHIDPDAITGAGTY
jgi:hypothetical protein